MSDEMPEVIYAAAKKGEGGSDHWARREYPGCHRYWRDDIVLELATELFYQGDILKMMGYAEEGERLMDVANRFLGEAG